MVRQRVLNFELGLVALVCGALWLAACMPQSAPAVPVATTEVTVSRLPPMATATLSATASLAATDMPTTEPTHTLPRPSATLVEYELIETLLWTHVPTPSSRTPVPIAEEDSFRLDLTGLGYQEFYSTSTLGPGRYTYSVYVYIDDTFQAFTKGRYPEVSFREAQETEGCRIAFYRWDGKENVFLYSFPGAIYPEDTVYAGYPVMCMPLTWTSPGLIMSFLYIDFRHIPQLNMDGPWSDVNQNGLPEFAMYYQYCSNGCLNSGAIAIHLYEIQSTSKIVDITADLPGVLDPSQSPPYSVDSLVHSADPLELYVYDPTLWYCYKWCIIESWWIYSWDGKQLVDVTPKYADEVRQRGQEIVAEIKQFYGQSLENREWKLLQILFMYEKAGLRDEALAEFMEISDPKHWPVDEPEFTCWLQVTRASIQEDYRLGRPYQLPKWRLTSMLDTSDGPEWATRGLDASRYDLSACQAFQKTPTP